MPKRAPQSESELNRQITNDLIHKVNDDVQHAVVRVLSLAPFTLPIVLQATVTTLGILREQLRVDGYENLTDGQLAILAALIAARTTNEGDLDAAIRAAGKDLIALVHARRITP